MEAHQKFFLMNNWVQPDSLSSRGGCQNRSVAVVVAVLAIATVSMVLGRVVMGSVGWCRGSGGRIQANYATTFGEGGRPIVVDYLDRSSNDAIQASKVLQESCLSPRCRIILA